MTSTLIVAVGSSVMKDDGVGVRIIGELKRRKLNADYADLGTDIFRLRLHFANHSKVIIIDALLGGGIPGTIRFFPHQDFHNKLEGNIKNAHLLGIIEGIELMRLIDNDFAKTDLWLVGVIAEDIDKGIHLSPNISHAVPKAADLIIEFLINEKSFHI